jgi:pimeloyl-ACP methyl ester carboxylesterase
VKNIDINYEIHGEGFPLVMIMGLSANIDWWQPDFVTAVAKHFKTIVFDNRGAGRSTDPGVDYTVKTLAEDTVGLMDALKIPKAHVLGISLGGMIAQELALNFPKRVEKLILAATMPGGPKQVPPGPAVIKLLGADRTKKTEEQKMADMIPILYTEGYAKSHPEEIKLVIQQFLKAPIKDVSYQRQLKAIITFDSTKRLKNIKMPTLIVHGKQDILIPPGNAKMLSELIKGSKFLLFDGSAHAVFSEEKDKVWPSVIDFLK